MTYFYMCVCACACVHTHTHTHASACSNLRFADDIDGLAGEEGELANLLECLDKASTAYGMEISAERICLMTNNTSGIDTEIKIRKEEFSTPNLF